MDEISNSADNHSTSENKLENDGQNPDKLSAAYEAEKRQRKLLQKELSDLKASFAKFDGFDPEDYQRLKDDANKRKNQELEAKGEYQKLIESERKKFEADRLQLQKDVAEATARAEQATIERGLVLSFSKAGGNPEYLPHFLKMGADGLRVKDGSIGFPSTTREDGTEIESLEDYVAHLRDKGGLGIYFSPQNKAAGSNDTGGKTPQQIDSPKIIDISQAGSYLEEVAKGTVRIKH